MALLRSRASIRPGWELLQEKEPGAVPRPCPRQSNSRGGAGLLPWAQSSTLKPRCCVPAAPSLKQRRTSCINWEQRLPCGRDEEPGPAEPPAAPGAGGAAAAACERLAGSPVPAAAAQLLAAGNAPRERRDWIKKRL